MIFPFQDPRAVVTTTQSSHPRKTLSRLRLFAFLFICLTHICYGFGKYNGGGELEEWPESGFKNTKRVLLELRSGPVFEDDGWFHFDGTRTALESSYDRRRRRRRLSIVRRGLDSPVYSFPDSIRTRSSDWGWLRDTQQMLVGCANHSHDLIDHLEKSGCRISGYYPNKTMLVVGSPEALETGVGHEHIVWTKPFQARYKVAPEWERVINLIEDRRANGIAKNVTMKGYGHLPIDVMYTEKGEALFGVRAVFPSLQKPRPHHPSHDRFHAQNKRIERWEEYARGSHHGGIAAAKDWRSAIEKEFSVAHLEQHGREASKLYVPLNELQKAINWLAERHVVHWVEPVPRYRMLNRQASTITQSGRAAPNAGEINTDPKYHPIWSAGITGEGMVIGIGDSGLDYKHCFFADPDTNWEANIVTVGSVLTFTSTTHRKIRLYRAFADFRDDNGHGTHTCGTLAGIPYGNTLAETSSINIGMAPGAKLAFIDLSSVRDGDRIITPGDLANQYFKYTTDVGATVHSDSWGSTNIYYDYEAYQVDKFCWENPTFLPVFPAGNDGDRATRNGDSGTSTVNSPATAKNCLAVGATQTAGVVATSTSKYETFSGTIYINGIQSTSFPVLLSTFSPAFTPSSGGQYGLVVSDPVDACSPLANAADLVGKYVLIERGTCEFIVKAQNAQQAGAAGVIIFDNVAGAYFMPDTSGNTVNIPVGFIPRRIGQNLLAGLEAGQALSIAMGPGPSGDLGYENLAEFSSQGPVQPDRRVKPDVVAPGIVTSAKAGTACSYATYAGTSMATPVAAGNALLIQQYFKDGFYPTGVAVTENGFMPSSALVKAVMMGGAEQITGYEADTGLPIDPAPSFRQGYGRIDLGASLQLQNNPYNPKSFQILDSIDISDGEKHFYCVQSTGGPLSITVAWTDLPANPSSRKTLMNDIDLVVRAEGYNGISMLGNGGDIDDSSLPDNVNNVEQVRFQYLPAGKVSVQIIGSQIYSSQAGPQPYSLVINGDFEGTLIPPSGDSSECPVISAEITSGPGSLTNQDVVSFEFGLGGGGGGGVAFECKLEAVQNGEPLQQAWSPCSSPQTFQNLQDGEYVFSVKPAQENSIATQTFVVDRTPPNLQVAPVEAPRGTAKFQIEANDFTETSTECMLTSEVNDASKGSIRAGEVIATPINLGEWFACSSGITLGWLLPGQWKFSTRATDVAGNISPIVINQINVGSDSSESLVYISDGPFLTVPKSEIVFSTASFSGNQQSQQQTECALMKWPTEVDNPGVPQKWEPCQEPQSYGVLTDGKYSYFSKIARSPVETSALSTFTVDEIAPTVNMVGNIGPFTSPVATFQFNLSEVGSTECKLTGIDAPEDSMDWTPCIQPVQYQNLTGGKYLFEVRGTDAVGNKGEPTSTEFVVDLDPPVVMVDYKAGTRDPTMTVTFTADDGVGSGVANVTCQIVPIKLVGQQFDENSQLWDPKPCESPWTFDLQEGEWQISIVATDNAGLTSIGDPITIWMDTIPPAASIVGGPSQDTVNPGGTAIFNISDTSQGDGGSPVLWQGYLTLTSSSIDEQPIPVDQPSSTGGGAATMSTSSVHTIKSLEQSENILGESDLDTWANCSRESCTYEGLKQGTYTFIARGVDAAENVGQPSSPYVFKMEGASSSLPTWALIVIIVGSCVVGIVVLSFLWCCCCHKRSPSKTPNGMSGPVPINAYNGNGYMNGHANSTASNYMNRYGSTASYPIAGARPYSGAVNIPQDPIEAQAQALRDYGAGPHSDEEEMLRRALEESRRSARESSIPRDQDVNDIDLAIALSLSESQNGTQNTDFRPSYF